MAYDDVEILRDKNGNPIPQYYNIATGQFEPLTGENGATHTQLTGSKLGETEFLPVRRYSEVITLVNAQSVSGSQFVDISLDYRGETFRIISVAIDQQPWSIRTNSIYRSIPDYSLESGLFPS